MRRLATALIAVALVAPACGSNSDAIVIGAIYPTRGTQGPGGVEEWRGVQLAAEYAGSPVDLRLEPVESRDEAPAAVEKLHDAGIDIVIGTYGSTISRPVANATSRLGMLFWETGAVGGLSMEADLGDHVFRVPANGHVLGSQASQFVRTRLDLGDDLRWAVTYVDDDYGSSVGIGAIDDIEAAGHDLVKTYPYDLETVDFDAMASDIAANDIDVLVVSAYLEDGADLRRAIVNQEVPLAAMIGTSSSYCMPAFGEMLGPDAVGVFASDKPDAEIVDPDQLSPAAAKALRWAREEYRARFDEGMPAAALSGFSGAWALFGHVLPDAKTPAIDDISASARKQDMPFGSLPNGSGLRFVGPDQDNAGENARAASVIWQWVAPRQREIVWPPAFKTHDVIDPGTPR